MADTKISALTAAGAAALANEHAINEAGTSKKVTQQQILDATDLLAAGAALADANKLLVVQSSVAKSAALTALVTYLQTKGMPRVTRLGSQHSISSATATKVTGLDQTLEAGTYTFDYYLIVRSSTAADGVMVGVNFSTGTATVKTMIAYWADNTAAVTAEVHSMSDQGNKGFGFISGMASKAYTTTAPDMGTTIGVKTTGSDTTMRVSGIMIVTVQGNIELWHGSESTNATSVEVGSSLVVIRTA